MTIGQRRGLVVAEAETWLRTPYHHMARVKGAGADCLTLLAEVYEKAGVIPQYPSGAGRLPSGGLMWRDCAVVQTPVFAPVQETVRWQVSRYWLVVSGVAGGASSRSKRS